MRVTQIELRFWQLSYAFGGEALRGHPVGQNFGELLILPMAIQPLVIPTRIYGEPTKIAPDVNDIVDKINELVDAVNAGLATINAIVGGDKYVQ
ncbi:MAG: hypothetical protein EOO61_20790, partial [Hymenobacter sp.]